MDSLLDPGALYAFLQLGVLATFGITALRAWQRSRARFVELASAFGFGLLLEQGDIFLFGTYRYNPHWFLLGDVPVAIAMTWALIIVGAMNITDALGLPDASTAAVPSSPLKHRVEFRRNALRALPAPMADAVWAIMLDLALDAVAIRLGLWTWTIRAGEGWFGVPWGNFFAWLLVAFWFSFFTRLARARAAGNRRYAAFQWIVPFLSFGGLIAVLVPFVAVENTAALPFVPDGGGVYHNEVWVVFALALALFSGITLRAVMQKRTPRERADHWLLLVRLMIHGLFLLALFASGIYLKLPVLVVVALLLLLAELLLTRAWLVEGVTRTRQLLGQTASGVRVK